MNHKVTAATLFACVRSLSFQPIMRRNDDADEPLAPHTDTDPYESLWSPEAANGPEKKPVGRVLVEGW